MNKSKRIECGGAGHTKANQHEVSSQRGSFYCIMVKENSQVDFRSHRTYPLYLFLIFLSTRINNLPLVFCSCRMCIEREGQARSVTRSNYIAVHFSSLRFPLFIIFPSLSIYLSIVFLTDAVELPGFCFPEIKIRCLIS